MQIRDLQVPDLTAVQRIYRLAFAGFPWYESLTEAEMSRRFNEMETKVSSICYQGLIAVQDEAVVGAIWWEIISIEGLRQERGDELATFAQSFPREYLRYVWEREVVVSPSYQGRGISLALRQEFIQRLHTDYKPVMILTRMRDDNLPILRIAERCGFLRTGIKIPSSQVPGLNHEYWYYEEYFFQLLRGDR